MSPRRSRPGSRQAGKSSYDVVKAKGTKRLPEANLGLVNSQAEKLACDIVDFNRME